MLHAQERQRSMSGLAQVVIVADERGPAGITRTRIHAAPPPVIPVQFDCYKINDAP